MFEIINNIGSSLALVVYLVLIGYTYFLTERCAQKYIKSAESQVEQRKEVSEFNIYLVNRGSLSRKTLVKQRIIFRPYTPHQKTSAFL